LGNFGGFQKPGGVFLPHPPAPSPKREGEARLLGFVDF